MIHYCIRKTELILNIVPVAHLEDHIVFIVNDDRVLIAEIHRHDIIVALCDHAGYKLCESVVLMFIFRRHRLSRSCIRRLKSVDYGKSVCYKSVIRKYLSLFADEEGSVTILYIECRYALGNCYVNGRREVALNLCGLHIEQLVKYLLLTGCTVQPEQVVALIYARSHNYLLSRVHIRFTRYSYLIDIEKKGIADGYSRGDNKQQNYKSVDVHHSLTPSYALAAVLPCDTGFFDVFHIFSNSFSLRPDAFLRREVLRPPPFFHNLCRCDRCAISRYPPRHTEQL